MTEAWAWPQYVMCVWLLLQTLGMTSNDLDKPTRYQRGIALAATVTVQALLVFVLYAGGFWS